MNKMNEQDLSHPHKIQSDSKMTESETLAPLPTEDRTNEMPTDEKIRCDVCWSNFRIPNCSVIRNLTWENRIFQDTFRILKKA